ncbi:MAG: hydroxypyruvate isomerase [Planctomycetaceae bacterium]|nr:hydroxypyruvate isomerase [Planctomycetaceae bacterium]
MPNGRIQHSIVHWCFADYWTVEQTCQIARNLGCLSIELVAPDQWPTLKKYGLGCAIAGSHLFVQGMNQRKYQPMCLALLRQAIDDCADANVPTVITFTGYDHDTGEPADGQNPELAQIPENPVQIDPDEGLRNCVTGYKEIVGYAEKKKVSLSLEMLNTRVTTHPMKGHPGYQGDQLDYCAEIINQVGSPRLGLLFDAYHVQIMEGDLVTRIHEYQQIINHVHTAGNPGRGELDASQEINYPPLMRALVDVGYQGFVGHEFIPTRDPLKGLSEAVAVCDI